jgi:hypothetical protein
MTFELQLTVALADPTPPYEQVRRELEDVGSSRPAAPGVRTSPKDTLIGHSP